MGHPASLVGAQPFLHGLPENYIAQLAADARHISLPARCRLFDEGGTADRFWIIDAGQAALDVLIPGKGRMVIETLVS